MKQTISPEVITALLAQPMKVIAYSEIDSTNSEAKRLIANGLTEPALLVADQQTAGKGRLGRSFYSPSETGLYMSVVLHPNAPPSEWLSVTAAAAVAVCLAIESLSSLRPQIKWVNDIYLDDRKVCGILTEAVTDSESRLIKSLVIGIGINLSTAHFPSEFADRAGALFADSPPPFDRNQLAAAIADRLTAVADDLQNQTWLPRYRSRSWLDGKDIVYYENNIARTARAIGIDSGGGLIVEEAGERKTIRSGEVTVRLTTATMPPVNG